MRKLFVTVFLSMVTLGLNGLTLGSQTEGDTVLVISDDKVNVRAEPSTDAKVLRQLNTGDMVFGNVNHPSRTKEKVGDAENYWYQINLDGHNSFGYVWGEFVAVSVFKHHFGDQALEIVSTKTQLGMYLNYEYVTEGLAVFADGRFYPLKFDKIKSDEFQSCVVFKLNNGSYLLQTSWSFADAGAGTQIHEIFDFNPKTMTTKQIAYYNSHE